MTAATQRFLFALAALIAGVGLYAMGQGEPGALLIGAAVGYLAPRKTAAPLLLAFLLLPSCTPGKAYVAADQGIYNAIAPEYLRYVEHDPDMDSAGKARRGRTVEAWKVLLDKASKGDK